MSDDIVLAAYLAGCACLAYVDTYMTKVPLHTNPQIGLEWVQYILTGHEKLCRRNFRLSSYVFRDLCNTLRASMDIKVPEMLPWKSLWQ